MVETGFDTELVLRGPVRAPKQMLAEQTYGGHVSIHDDAMADKLGFKAGPIEGPTHFSQFVPLCAKIWGQRWFERGCLSSHFKNVCVEGDEVQAFAVVPEEGATQTRIWAEKSDGTLVLEGTASVGPEFPKSELDTRMAGLRAPERLIILRDMQVGARFEQPDPVVMDFDQHMGNLYPFTLNDKLRVITELSPWYTSDGGASSPWGRAVIPLEMISVLAEYTNGQAQWPVRGPVVGLFADLEIRMVNGPLFVGQPYLLDREVLKLSESRRTESYWVRTSLRDPDTKELLAYTLLNHAVLKESFADYATESA